MNKRVIISLLLLLLLGTINSRSVYADELLQVDIKSYDGSKLLVCDGAYIYAATPLVFLPNADEGASLMYSLSTDYGETFGGYVTMDDSSLTLYPDTAMNEQNYYVIRFISEKGEDRRYSREYHVSFDYKIPDISIENPQVLSGWITQETELILTCTDDTGIGRIIASIDGRVLYEEHHVGKIENKERCLTKKINLPLSEVSDGANGVSIDVIVSDLAGNTAECEYTYYLDNSVPALAITGVCQGEYLTDVSNIKLIPTGDYNENDYIAYEITCHNNEAVLSQSGNAECSSSGISIPIEQEGRYELEAYTYDLAGNISDKVKVNFIYDMQAPTISIEGVAEGVDYKDKVTVKVLIEEMIYENCNVSITAIRRKGKGMDNLPVQSYVLEACREERELTFVNDGDYELYVSATDGANRTTNSSVSFRIDKKAPVIHISGINEGEVTSSKPKINISSHELFYDAAIITSELLKNDGNGNYESIISSQNVMKEVDDQFQMDIEEEGCYKLRCIATDRTGNCREESLDFTVDYTPPVISKLTEYDGKYLGAFFAPTNIRDLISDRTSYTYDATLNDEYVEEKSSVIEEGKYVLRISATDEAGNYSEEDALFIIDHTAPQIILSGMKKDGTIKRGSELTVALNDYNDELSEVLCNDQPVEMSPDHKIANIKVDDYGDVCLKIKAFDAAGNNTYKELYMQCARIGNVKQDYVKEETIIKEISPVSKENDIDFKGILVGLASVLTGTFGLVARVACME